MQETPFKYLQRNISKVRFECDGELRQEYRRTFSNVLERLDKYFKANGLYKCADYQTIVEDIISGKNPLKLAVDETGRADGNYTAEEKRIRMPKSNMFKGERSEHILCHEFIHHINLSPISFEYEREGKFYKVIPHHHTYNGISTNPPTVQVKTKGANAEVNYLSDAEVLNGGFICEGMTELLTEKIYGMSYGSYADETRMVKFMNKLLGEQFNTEDFLHRNMETAVRKMGLRNYEEFIKMTNQYFLSHKAGEADCYKYYVKSQDILVNALLEKTKQNLSKSKASNIIDLFATILAESPEIGRYNTQLSDMLKEYSVAQLGENSPHLRQFTNLLKDTTNRVSNQTSQSYPIKNANSFLSIKDNKVMFNFRELHIPIKDITSTTYQGRDGSLVSAHKNEQGIIEFSIKVNREEIENIKVFPNSTNPNQVAISNTLTGEKQTFDFDKANKRNSQIIEENRNLLDNPRYIHIINSLISSNSSKKYYNFSKVVSNKGEEYLIASSNQGPTFIKIMGNARAAVEIVSKNTLPETNIQQKFTTGPKNTGMIGYAPTQHNTAEDSFVYTLADGTEFVGYYRDNKWTYGEQISPFSTGQKVVIEQQVDSLYSTDNPDMKTLFATSTFKQEIKREPTARDVEAEKKAQEQERLRREQEERERQEKLERERQERRNAERISQEEQERRNKEIERERRRKAEIEEQQSTQFNRVKQDLQEPIYDEYDVDVSYRHRQATQQQQQHYQTQGRSR